MGSALDVKLILHNWVQFTRHYNLLTISSSDGKFFLKYGSFIVTIAYCCSIQAELFAYVQFLFLVCLKISSLSAFLKPWFLTKQVSIFVVFYCSFILLAATFWLISYHIQLMRIYLCWRTILSNWAFIWSPRSSSSSAEAFMDGFTPSLLCIFAAFAKSSLFCNRQKITQNPVSLFDSTPYQSFLCRYGFYKICFNGISLATPHVLPVWFIRHLSQRSTATHRSLVVLWIDFL